MNIIILKIYRICITLQLKYINIFYWMMSFQVRLKSCQIRDNFNELKEFERKKYNIL